MNRNKATHLIYALLFLLQLVLPGAKLQAKTPVFNIKNFSKNNYHASKQNWAVDRSPNGFLYFANHGGLLEFDGVDWKLYRLPNETNLRSVLALSDSLIYTSGYRELGYWLADENGFLQYHSLNELAAPYFSDNEEFWNIAILDDAVYFHSFNSVLIYRNKEIKPIKLPGFSNTMHRVNNDILLAVSDQGIFKIKQDGQTQPYIQSSFFNGLTIRFILPYGNNQIMFGTNSNGIFISDGQSIREWNPTWTDYFKKNEVNRGFFDQQGRLIIGTLIDGILIFEKDGSLVSRCNTDHGLQNNTVLGITTDQFNNIWLALDNGIDFISNDRNLGFEIETLPEIGAVYDAAVFENQLYLGTNQGLFRRAINDNQGDFQLVPSTQNQVWELQIYNNHLFAGHNDGTLLIKDGKHQFISRQSGGFSIREDPMKADYLLESTYSNIIRIKQEENTYRQDGVIKGFFDLIRYIEIDHLGDIWASHMRRGIYRLQLNNKRDSVLNRIYYGKESVFKKDHSVHVFKVENRIVFTTEELLYTYNDLTDSILPYDLFNEQLGPFIASKRIIAGPDHHYWFITGEQIGLFKIFNNTIEQIKTYPRSLFAGTELIEDYENILPLTETKAIVCLENGIARIDAAISDTSSVIESFQPKLRDLELTSSRGETVREAISGQDVHIKYKYHNLHLRYSFPYYTHNPIYFQSYLKGLDQDWSEKSTEPRFVFDRLPAGNYTLLVKAIDQWGNESQVDSLSFKVAPPWYLTNYARAIYLLLFVAGLLGFRTWGIQQTRKKERLEHDKKEKELIRLRNEKLRDEIQHKSKELANSTMSIIKKNEFLLEIKELVSKQKEQLGSRFPDKYYNHLNRKIDENMSSDDDWQLFETNFERAHEQFLTKIKLRYPELTAKDLRLCAFLRMNLSSKEIAPLLGISVRGVENHRYRLRKKMNLDHDEKLTDLILEL
ncbi:triple tyrosine motif-containing protein [uncultured Sunxiuqinia sp.]|uniref:helix-turn-helix and ligand-binding sensor domain-containing protein n=1 Tax=uncultured Sunxiuqinia sp. TaxID=1573825 RepID=UPI002637F8EF|nr:triple tyrosine motif-containing protein [uncultured Sunxiuqinia sp.]